MARRVAVITKDRDRQFEALRSGLGLLLENHIASLFVLDHELDATGPYLDTLKLADEMGGGRYSNNPVNVERHGFRPVSIEDAGRLVADCDLVIPF
jgi:hypothetical protein